MRSFFSLLHREMLILPRKRFFLTKRVTFVLLIGFVLYMPIYSLGHRENPSAVGLQTFAAFSITVFWAITLLAPASASGILGKEKSGNTLELLLLTDMTPMGIILGKFLSEFFLLLLNFASALPLLMVCMSIGGISGEQIVSVFFLLITYLVFGVALGIMVSVWVEPKSAQSSALALLLVLLVGGMITYGILNGMGYPVDWTITLLPFLALLKVLEGAAFPYYLVNGILNLLFAFFFLSLASRSLPSCCILLKKAPLHVRWKRYWHEKFRKKHRKMEPVRGNPVAWRDYHKVYGGKFGRNAKILFIILFMLFVTWAIFTLERNPRDYFTGLMGTLFFTFFVACFVVVLFSSTRAFAVEKQNKTLELLLTTSLTEREIVLGKISAIFTSILPFIVTCFFSGIFLFMSPKFQSSEGKPLIFVFWGICYIFGVCGLGIFVSSQVSSLSKASSYTMLILFGWHISSNMIFYNIARREYGSSFVVFGIFYLFVAFLFYSFTVSHLRTNLTRQTRAE